MQILNRNVMRLEPPAVGSEVQSCYEIEMLCLHGNDVVSALVTRSAN